jgi:hypothetical protein
MDITSMSLNWELGLSAQETFINGVAASWSNVKVLCK